MILVGNQRAGARDLALHLLKEENERVEVHELRGFASTDLREALQESYAVSRATRCKQHLYSLSLNPPKDANVDDKGFRAAVDKAEERLGLQNQPRAIVFHVKDGRKHAHAVWCRIDTENMRSVHMSKDWDKLQDVARELYLEHGWKMPRGFVSREARDPRTYSLAEWQQAKRAKRDPKVLKGQFQDAWAISDSKAAYEAALKERGFILARGDRRGYVAVDHTGEVYAIAKWSGQKTKAVKDRLGPADGLPSVAEARNQAAARIAERLRELQREEAEKAQARKDQIEQAKERIRQRHAKHMEALKEVQAERWTHEATAREKKIRKGLWGLLDRLTGQRKRQEDENARAEAHALERDRRERAAKAEREARLQAAFEANAREREELRKAIHGELTQDIRDLRQSSVREERMARYEETRAPPRQSKSRRPTHQRDGPGPQR